MEPSHKWQPEDYHKDPTVNALLNIADGLHMVAHQLDQLFYAFGYSKVSSSVSLSEEVHVAAKTVAGAIEQVRLSFEEKRDDT